MPRPQFSITADHLVILDYGRFCILTTSVRREGKMSDVFAFLLTWVSEGHRESAKKKLHDPYAICFSELLWEKL